VPLLPMFRPTQSMTATLSIARMAVLCALLCFSSENMAQSIAAGQLTGDQFRPIKSQDSPATKARSEIGRKTQASADPGIQTPDQKATDKDAKQQLAAMFSDPAQAKDRSQPESAALTQQTPRPKRVAQGLSDEDIATISSLPPICTGELPGLDLSNVKPAQARLANEKRDINRRVIEAAERFEWPDMIPKPLEPTIPVDGTASPSPSQFRVAQTGFQSSTDKSAAAPNPHAGASAANPINLNSDGTDPHLEIYSRSAFPSAKECATCHKQIYEEWAVSSHAYAAVSPMFSSFEDKLNKLAQGTLGYFCLRCHAPVATTMGLRRDQAIWDGPRVFKEGVTCVACHRVKIPYTKSNGERRMEPGDIYQPVYGAGDGKGVDIVNKYSQFFKTKSNPSDSSTGQPIHRRSIQFEELAESTFCMSCHQVAVEPGIKLEVVWDQYRASPACKQGVSCQDCHMGKVPGVDAGYSIGPAAVVNEKVVNPERKHSNHMFYGPGYSIAHPGVFPDNLKADRWKFNQWLEFDWRGGWGTQQFEDAIARSGQPYFFPETWRDADDRYDARDIIDENLKKLEYERDIRRQIQENGSKLDGPFFAATPTINQPLKFRYCLTNLNPGHNMPSGSLGAQPQIWMNTVLIGPDGQRIWETGYLDSNGDLADQHSLDVLARRLPLDTQLLNLQTKFLTTNVKGTDREMYLPINFDIDQLPFLRPAQQPVSVINHPPFIRMESHSIPALGSRNVKYVVPSRLMTQRGVYRLSVRLRSRAEPIYFMRFCNATPEMERMMNEGIADFHTSTVTFEVR
jgi:hypothetical protein